jgi:hypothetical protein
MAAQSTIFPIFLRAEYREGQLQGFISEAKRSADMAKAEFRSVGAVLDEALSRKRNTSGSLDLGIDELKAEAAAQRARAIAAREVAEATARIAPAQAKAGVSLTASTAAARTYANEMDRLANELEQQVRVQNLVQAELNKTASATDLVTSAARRGTTARGNVINSARSERTAFIQLGQQMQDMTVQAQLGTNAFIIMGQQLPQAAFALSGLADSANKTKAAVGRLATFLSGPWGAAVFVGLAVLGPFVQKLFEAGNEADKARVKTFNFVDGLDVLKLSAEDATAAMDQLASSLRGAITLQGDFLRGEVAIARQSATTLQAQIDADQAELTRLRQQRSGPGANLLPTLFGPSGAELRRERQLQDRLSANRDRLGPALENAGLAAVAEANRNIAEASDPLLRQINDIDEAIARLNRRREQTVRSNDPLADGNLSQADFQRQLDSLASQRAALEVQQRESRKSKRSDRSGEVAARRAALAAEQLVDFGKDAAEQIQRINERFNEQPRLIDAADQATRRLNEIIKELGERKPANFETLIEEARKAEQVIKDAMQRPIEDILRLSEERLAVEQLLAQGRVDEAVALQEIQRLQEQIGELTDAQKDDIRDTIALEGQKTRELRAQAELMELQADVARTVADSLRDLFSGRGTFNDLIKNFRQSLQDLQGARLFEDLFGPAFRQLEEELRGNTPQGRANARYTAEVEKTADTTARLESTFDSLGQAATDLNDRLTKAAFPGYNPGGAANDNFADPRFSLARTIAEGAGLGGITVRGNRAVKVDVQRKSIKDLADTMAKATVAPLVAELEGLLGPKFAAQLGGVLSGALAGLVRGGKPGAVLGGAQGLTDALNSDGDSKFLGKLSAKLGEALDATQTGTTVNQLGTALGIKGSKSGAQIGAAVGKLSGIPGGEIIGAIAGNIIGGLVKGTPRGSATIGGVGGSLGVSGTRGNSNNLREAAGDLAGSVIDAVADIAKQLGASVDAARGGVSIGLRNDDIRVDTTGRGITKTGNGAIDFGDDAEAAIAFAVQDLINDGVITGLRASEQRLLQAGRDVQAALEDVLTFRSVFDRLQQIKDPVGFAVTQLNREFENLIELFTRAGASAEEFAQLEELYGLERARAIEEATSRTSDALKQLLNDLKIGDSGLSLRSRRSNALGQFNDLAGRVAAGDSSAFDDFAEISQQLLDIERQLFGSTQSYFDRLAQITALTEQAIAGQGNVVGIGATLPGSPFDDRTEINRSIDQQTAEVTGWLRAINDNLIALSPAQRIESFAGSTTNNRGSVLPSAVQNF